MSTGGKKNGGCKATGWFLSALIISELAFIVPVAAQNPNQPDARNMELMGASQYKGQTDIGPYSKMSPWPNPDGQYFYSGCYDPAPLDPRPEAAQCFMTISLKDPNKPERLATVYVFDPVASPEPPASHPVWKSKELANLPVKVPCDTFKDPEVLAGKKRPACWDPGWNTHTHYVAEGPGKILAVNEERRRGIGTDSQANYHGVSFYDISNPAKPVFLSRWQAPISDPVDGDYPEDADGIHHFNFRNQGEPGFLNDNNNRYLFLGANYKGYVGMILVILDARDPRHPVEAATWHIPGQKTPEEDAQRDWVQQRNFSSPIRKDPATGKLTKHVAMHYPTVYGNIAYLSYRQGGLVTLDVSDIKNPKLLSRLDYLVPGFDDPTMPESMKKFPLDTTAYGNAHSAKLVPGRKDLLWLTDEYFSCPYGHLRMVDVSDPRKPKIISHFLYPENTACDPANPGEVRLRRDSRGAALPPTSATSAMACSSSPGTACARAPSTSTIHCIRWRRATSSIKSIPAGRSTRVVIPTTLSWDRTDCSMYRTALPGYASSNIPVKLREPRASLSRRLLQARYAGTLRD